ncbi:alanine--tRNA ligase [Myxococcota bacterium]|nr:alanine--tRNA ligase [Myxococcota bacterium]
MHAQEIRDRFVRFFAERGHRHVPSSSLVPEGDPTLFFANAGMVQFKGVFTGEEVRDYSRAVTVQKCMRVSGKHNDLENVGFTARHHTLFEMLGNFSFGDYFKRDAIAFAWELLTQGYGLPVDRLWVTVFTADDEAYGLWRDLGVPPERIARCGEKDNFWAMGDTGPCGPCSEIFWDLGEDFLPDGEPDPWGRGHDAGRYLEIWNLVFMQYERAAGGELTPLPRPSIDTGMGLERLASVLQGKRSNWDTDEFQALVALESTISGVPYGRAFETDASLKVIADHARAAAFLVADGVMPSNEGRGYVLRRVMRRAIRHGVKLGIERPFLHEVASKVVDLMGPAYPELEGRRAFLVKAIHAEERAFRETLTRGLSLLDEAFAREEVRGGRSLPGQEVFVLHDTFGFPPDLTAVIARERGFEVDMVGYDQAMEEQRQRGREAWKGSGEEAGAGGAWSGLAREGVVTEFLGYEGERARGRVIRLLRDGAEVPSARAGEEVDVVLDRTPFYAESGGQVGDTGTLLGPGGEVEVLDTRRAPASAAIVHRGRVVSGLVAEGVELDAVVDAARRADVMRNHTATHLLHAALRATLGPHVQQKGSLVAPDRLRFDYSHFEPLTAEQLRAVEEAVNEEVRKATATRRRVTSYQEALASGAIALFGEKYGDQVRVVEVPGFSTELCGGIHCENTGQVGLFKVVSETGVAAGVRRIEAVTGRGAEALLRDLDRGRRDLAALLKVPEAEVHARVEKLLEERRGLQRQVDELRQEVLTGGGGGPVAREVAGVKVLAREIQGADPRELRALGDRFLEALGRGVVVLGIRDDEKATLLVKVSADLTDRVHAGRMVNELARMVGGRGGGRPDMAQAGGQLPGGLPQAIEKAHDLVAAALEG